MSVNEVPKPHPNSGDDLQAELDAWERASDEDFARLETAMTAPMTTAEKEQLRALCGRATPGPWEVGTAEDGQELERIGVGSEDEWICDVDISANITRTSMEQARPNAAFIAAARNALPRLLSEVEQFRALLTECRDTLYLLSWLDAHGLLPRLDAALTAPAQHGASTEQP